MADESGKDHGRIFILQHTDDVAADQVALMSVDADEWVVGFGFGNVFRAVGDVMRALEGETLDNSRDLPALEDQADTALRVVDFLRTDRAARTRLTALLAPEPDDPALEGRGNDRRWVWEWKENSSAVIEPYRRPEAGGR